MATIDLRGRPIAITGASSGIGAATAVACAEAGMPVALMARREDKLREVAERVRARGGAASVFAGSVDDADACRRFIGTAERELGPVYAVFANAGYGFEKPAWSLPDEELRAIFEVNLWGSLHVIRAALDGMLARGSGHALLCSSCVSKIGLPMYGPYCATKAAQDHLGRAMRLELAGRGVAVSTVHPVGTKTEFFDKAGERSGGRLAIQSRTPSAAMQTPEKVAGAIVRRLRSGRGGEVWTSVSTRLALAAATAFPGLTDAALRIMLRQRLETGGRGATAP